MSSQSAANRENVVAVLNRITFISLAGTRLWSGRAKLSREDLDIDEDQLPEAALASLGSKRVIDPEALKPLQEIRAQMHRTCLSVGTRFIGGYAIEIGQVSKVARKLNELVAEGDARKATFMRTVDSRINAWRAEHPKWSEILATGAPARDRIGNRIGFGYSAVMVGVPEDDAVAQSMMGDVSGLGGSMVDEIVKEAAEFVKSSLKVGRNAGSQRTVAPIRRLVDKIGALSFLEPRMAVIGKIGERILGLLPATGKVTSVEFVALARYANLLTDRAQMLRYGDEVQGNLRSLDDLLDEVIEAPKIEASVQAATLFGEKPAEAVNMEAMAQKINAAMADKNVGAIAPVAPLPQSHQVIQVAASVVPLAVAPKELGFDLSDLGF